MPREPLRGPWVGLRLLACVLLMVSGPVGAAITASKSVDAGAPGTILPGDPTRFRITLSNDNSGGAVTSVSFIDDMTAAGIRVVAPVSNSCGGTLTANAGASQFSLAAATIPIAPGGGVLGTCDIVVQVTSTVPGVRVNRLVAGSVSGNDPALVANAQDAVQTITVLSLQPPAIAKRFSPGAIVQGSGISRLRIDIVNPNASADLPLTIVTDPLPAGLQVAAAPNATLTCSGGGAVAGSFTPAPGDTSLTLTGGAVGSSGTCTLQVDVIGTSAGANGSQTLVNTLPAANVGNTRGLLPTANASAQVVVNSPLRVGKVFSPNPLVAGQQGTLRVSLFNDRPVGAPNRIDLTSTTDDPVGSPGGLQVTGTPSTDCAGGAVVATGAGTGFTLTGGVIPGAGSCTVTVPVTATLPTPGTPQVFSDTVAAGAVGNAQGFVSRPVSATVTVNDQLRVAKSVTPATVAPGNVVVYSVDITNFTTSAQAGVHFTDHLPAGITALASPAPSLSGAGCTGFVANLAAPSAPVFSVDMPAAPGASPALCHVTFTALVGAAVAVGSTPGNSLPAGSVGNGAVSNPVASNTATNQIIDAAPFTKAFNPSTLSEGGVSQLTLNFSNDTANPITILDLQDALPASGSGQVVVANPASASSTCAGAVITAVPGTGLLRLQGATVPARAGGGVGAAGTCQLQVNVSGPAGNYTNLIPANALQAQGTVGGVSGQPITYAHPVSAALSLSPALTAAKSFLPATIQAGGRSRVTIRLGNSGTGTLNNVTLTDVLPIADMTVANPPNAATTCGGAPALTATAGAGSAGLAGVVIPASAQCDFQFDVVSTSAVASLNTLPPGSISADGGVRNTAPVSATLTKAVGGIVVTKSVSPNTISAPGQAVTLTITLLNTGPVALSGIALNDDFTTTGLPGAPLTGMRVAAAPNASTTCTGAVMNAVVNAASVAVSGAALAPSGSAGDTCSVSVDVTAITVGTSQNTIPAGRVSSTQGVGNAGTAITSLGALGRLGVQKMFIPPTVVPGQRARLRLRFLNPIALPLAGLGVVDDLPPGLVVPPGANPVTTCVGATVSAPSATQVVVANGTLPAANAAGSTTCDADIDVLAVAAGAYANVIAAGAVTASAGGVPVSNPPPAAVGTLQVRGPATLTKAFSPSPVRTGQVSTLTITLANPNSIPLTGINLTDALPAGLAVALTPNALTTCGGAAVSVLAPASATKVGLTGATIAATGSCLLRVDTVSNVAGTYANVIPAGALTSAEGVGNAEPAAASVVVSAPPTVGKQFAPPSIPAGGSSTLTIALGNPNGASAVLTAALVDSLPAGLLIAAPNGLSTNCTGTVSATPGSAGLSFSSVGGQVPAGG